MTATATSRGAHDHRPVTAVLLALSAVLLMVLPVTPAAAASTTTVDVWFGVQNSECDALRAFPRRVTAPRVATGALEALLAGPTRAERRSAWSHFSRRTEGMLRSVNIRDGVAYVDFADLRAALPPSPEPCGVNSLLTHLDATVTQFPTVHRARYSINGSEATFYRWLGRGVPGTSRITRTRGTLRNQSPIVDLDGAGARVTALRVGRHTGFDRVVFEFTCGVPAYDVRYRGVAGATGSGLPIPLAGTTALEVRMGARTVWPPPDSPQRTFRPARLSTRSPTLRAVGYGGEFEGWSAFGVGLTGRSGFRVLELSNPPRLAIDVAHGAHVRDLRRGHRGPDVADWQLQLNTVQYVFTVTRRPTGGALATDGIFGTRTLRATRTFQRAELIPVTGAVDAATRAAMRRALRRAAQIRP